MTFPLFVDRRERGRRLADWLISSLALLRSWVDRAALSGETAARRLVGSGATLSARRQPGRASVWQHVLVNMCRYQQAGTYAVIPL